jgi:hypothetical protein
LLTGRPDCGWPRGFGPGWTDGRSTLSNTPELVGRETSLTAPATRPCLDDARRPRAAVRLGIGEPAARLDALGGGSVEDIGDVEFLGADEPATGPPEPPPL